MLVLQERDDGPMGAATRKGRKPPPRCTCHECRTGDGLPAHLQGWPGAYQIPLFPRAKRCAGFGDPPCYELEGSGPIDKPFVWKACGECLRDCGIEPGDEFDENAAVRALL